MMAPISNHDNLITRRSIFVGSAALLICAPAIVRAASLMPVRRLRGPIGPQYAGFCERLMYQSLASNLRQGRMSTVLNGKIIIEEDASRVVHAAVFSGIRYVLCRPISPSSRGRPWARSVSDGGRASASTPALLRTCKLC
jgi:hypothetical protein